VNEVAQWAVLVAVVVLLLGVLRQVSIVVPANRRGLDQAIPIGKRLARPVLQEVRKARNGSTGDSATLVAFVTESCTGCQRLLGRIQAMDDGELRARLVVVAKQPSAQFKAALGETGVKTIEDEEGELWEAAGVTATPLILAVDGDGRVIAGEVTHRVEQVAEAS
jgi:thioredoxin-related protein